MGTWTSKVSHDLEVSQNSATLRDPGSRCDYQGLAAVIVKACIPKGSM